MHDSLEKFTVHFVFKKIASLDDVMILGFDFLVNLHGQILNVFLQIGDALVETK